MAAGQSMIPVRLRGYVRARAGELARTVTRATSEPLAEWAIRRIRLDSRPFSFADHEFLRAIYDDTAQHVVLVKGAQVGGTSFAILRNLHSCIMGLNCIYFFPTRTDVLDFSRSRVTPLLAQNPFLAKLLRDTDTVGLKRLGDAFLYLRGMKSDSGMKSVPADVVTFDELDEATPEARSMALERLAHSDYKRVIELSNPSIPEFGIDESFQRSDQRYWTIRCDTCGRWTALEKEFPLQLGQEVRIIRPRDDGSYYRACPRCDAELDLAAGEWIPDYPDRTTHGYRISQLISSKVDPGDILEDYRHTKFPERFYNMKLGTAWADLQNRLDEPTVLACCGDHGMADWSRVPCTMGVDTGKDLHVVISRWASESYDRREIVYIGTRQSYAELDELMRLFSVSTCVIDALPEIHATRDFANRHAGRVFMNFFVEGQRGSYHWDPKERIVRENRTEALDASRQVIRDRRVVLPRSSETVREFATHLTHDVKRLEEDEKTGAKAFTYQWVGVNHYSLAFTYDCIAWSRDAGGPAPAYTSSSTTARPRLAEIRF